MRGKVDKGVEKLCFKAVTKDPACGARSTKEVEYQDCLSAREMNSLLNKCAKLLNMKILYIFIGTQTSIPPLPKRKQIQIKNVGVNWLHFHARLIIRFRKSLIWDISTAKRMNNLKFWKSSSLDPSTRHFFSIHHEDVTLFQVETIEYSKFLFILVYCIYFW